MGKKAPSRAKPAPPAKAGKAAKPKAPAPTSKKPTAKPAPKSAKPTPKPNAKPAPKPVAKPSAKPATKPVASKPKASQAVTSKSGKPAPAKAADVKSAAGKAPVVVAGKPGAKPPAGKPDAAAKGAAAAKAPAGKPAPGKPGGKAPVPAKAAEKAPDKAAEVVTIGPDGKPVRKGITIVQNKPRRTGPKPVKIQIPKNEPLLGPGSPFRKPLIASGPSAVRKTLEIDPEALAKLKSPFNKKELTRFRDILLKKRADLVGDVSDLESEALLGRSGSLSALPQHIAEQGSETYEQSLSLNLAAEDRRLIREIDGALQRIDKGTFGICEMTGKTITRERLEELPWTRYSIEAAREFERRSMGR